MKRLALGILFLAVSILPLTTAHAAAVDCFLFIAEAPGESVDVQHKNQIEVQAWNFAEFQPAPLPASAGGGGGRVQMQEFRFTARMSKASPILFRMCAVGTAFKGAILTCRRAGPTGPGANPDYLRITLQDVRVSSYQAGVPATSSTPFPPPGIPSTAFADGIPLDQVGLTFGRITVEYIPISPSGAAVGSVVGVYP